MPVISMFANLLQGNDHDSRIVETGDACYLADWETWLILLDTVLRLCQQVGNEEDPKKRAELLERLAKLIELEADRVHLNVESQPN